MKDGNAIAVRGQRRRHLLRNGNRTVTASGASDGDGEVRLPLTLVRREREADQVHRLLKKGIGNGVLVNISDHLRANARQMLQLRLIVRVSQKSDVENEVCIDGDAM